MTYTYVWAVAALFGRIIGKSIRIRNFIPVKWFVAISVICKPSYRTVLIALIFRDLSEICPNKPMPVEIRWKSIKDLIAHYEKHFTSIALCVQNISNSADKVYRYTEELQLRRECKNLLVFLEPATKTLNNLQSESMDLGDCFECWLDLYNAAPDHLKHFAAKRRDDYLTPVFLAAYLLDHRYEGRKLEANDTRKALAYIRSIDENAMGEVTKYMTRKPLSWWEMGKRLGFETVLVDVALALVSGVPNSAGLERCFSTTGMTYGKLRNQMEAENCGKLAFLYRELNKL